MSASIEARELVRQIVEPCRAGESVKALIRRAARVTGLSFGRVRSFWYGQARAIRAEEIDKLRQAVGASNGSGVGAKYDELAQRLARLEQRMQVFDPSFRLGDPSAYRQFLHGAGGSRQS